MEVRLLVTNESASTREVRLGPETFIGRSRECNLRIVSGQVSRKHCVITVRESRVLVRDLGSANGTEIDGTIIPPEIDVPVIPGSELVVGPLKFVFEFNPPPFPLADECDENLQSTTLDINPPLGPVEQGDTKEYGPRAGEAEPSPRAEPASDELDFTEGRPQAAADSADPAVRTPHPDSSLASAGETVFDSQLSSRTREAARRASEGEPLETGTELMVDGAAGLSKPEPADPAPPQAPPADARAIPSSDDESSLEDFFKRSGR